MQIKQRIKDSVKVLIGRSEAVPKIKNTPYKCEVCEEANVIFEPLPIRYLHHLKESGYIFNLFYSENYNLEKYTCNKCHASDRDRLYALYFNERLKNNAGVLNVLDIAPYAPFTKFLKTKPNLKIRTADLYMKEVDDNVDITDMNIYSNGQFDIFVCSHVLEHVPEDRTAMKELYRILKPGGWGIAQVPVLMGIDEDYENPDATTEEARWKYYGQDDHVRVYSRKGFVSKLESVGFTVHTLGIDHFGKAAYDLNGIYPTTILYVVEKK